MRFMLVVVLAIAAVLGGAPSAASAADGHGVARQAGHPTGAPDVDAAPAPAGPTFQPHEIAIGIGGIAALVLIALYALLPIRRRRVRAGPSEPRDHAPARTTAIEDQVTAALHRRTLRRAQVRLEEDPIIASMGVGSAKRAKPGLSRAQRAGRRSPPT